MNNFILLLLASTFAILLAHVNVGSVYADQLPGQALETTEVGVSTPLVAVPVESQSITEPSGLLVAPEEGSEQLILAPSESAGDYDNDEDEDIDEDEEEIEAGDEGGTDEGDNGDDDNGE